jgi:hypothetical protein
LSIQYFKKIGHKMKEEEEARESLSETKRNVKEKVFIA